MSDKELDKIEPVDFDLEESALFSSQPVPEVSHQPPTKVLAILAALVVVALLVIFVLPTVVSEYELPLERRPDVADIQSTPIVPDSATAISPFEEAQRSLQRKESQDVLAELLVKQSELDELSVLQWGETAYEAALQQASIGDDYYRRQEFELARNTYGVGLDALVELLESIPNVVVQTLIEARKAFESGDAAAAAIFYDLALLLAPDNEEASIGLQRSASLEEVAALLIEANDLFEDVELQRALELYRQIVGLDSFHDFARQRIAEAASLIRENEFARIMSAGYALLEAGEPDQAIGEFQQAAAMGINENQALAAIAQTENEVANAEIARLQSIITGAENGEQWQDAVTEYDNVLAIDPNLLFAINGRDYADKRARLNNLIVQALDNPERFADDEVFQQTRDVYFTGRAIEGAGSILVDQLDKLQGLLENSQIPLDILFESDNFTEVTLLRITSLGVFEQTSLSLKPGKYVAVGRRAGYREVRNEFTVGFGLTPGKVVVRCEERITANNGR